MRTACKDGGDCYLWSYDGIFKWFFFNQTTHSGGNATPSKELGLIFNTIIFCFLFTKTERIYETLISVADSHRWFVN